MSEWISVYDGLPDDNTCVDVWCDGPQDYEGRIENVFYDQETSTWWTHPDQGNGKIYLFMLNISHWMPLPEPPK